MYLGIEYGIEMSKVGITNSSHSNRLEKQRSLIFLHKQQELHADMKDKPHICDYARRRRQSHPSQSVSKVVTKKTQTKYERILRNEDVVKRLCEDENTSSTPGCRIKKRTDPWKKVNNLSGSNNSILSCKSYKSFHLFLSVFCRCILSLCFCIQHPLLFRVCFGLFVYFLVLFFFRILLFLVFHGRRKKKSSASISTNLNIHTSEREFRYVKNIDRSQYKLKSKNNKRYKQSYICILLDKAEICK